MEELLFGSDGCKLHVDISSAHYYASVLYLRDVKYTVHEKKCGPAVLSWSNLLHISHSYKTGVNTWAPQRGHLVACCCILGLLIQVQMFPDATLCSCSSMNVRKDEHGLFIWLKWFTEKPLWVNFFRTNTFQHFPSLRYLKHLPVLSSVPPPESPSPPLTGTPQLLIHVFVVLEAVWW